MSKTRPPWQFIAIVIYFALILPDAYCQETNLTVATVHGTDSPSKFENGFQIFWRSTPLAGDPNADQGDPEAAIEIFNNSANELAICRVATAIRADDATVSGISIYDGSARNPGFIAVAVVYARKEGIPIAALLYFNWDGSLLRKIALNHQSAIRSLEIDTEEHVWALNDFDRESPAKSVFTEFDRTGSVIGHFVKPRRHWSTEESEIKGGEASLA